MVFSSSSVGNTAALRPQLPTSTPRREPITTVSLLLDLVGSNKKADVFGLNELASKSNYIVGNDPKKWRTNIPNYAKVELKDIYPGISQIYYGSQGRLEYDLIVAPHADPRVIRLAFKGARIHIDSNGDLIIATGKVQLRQHKPVAYQETNGIRREVSASYKLRHKAEISLKLDQYDPSKPLVIDPVITYSTFLGGSGMEQVQGIAVDSFGNTYVAGFTTSTNFPTTSGVVNSSYGGSTDAFVAKLSFDGSSLIYATYIGGSGSDGANGVAIDSNGNVYVSGFTNSANFPTVNPLQGSLRNGSTDAFVTKLNPSGSALIYSTYLGGSNSDSVHGIAVDSSGNAYVAGETDSTDFPTMNPIQSANKGGTEAFVSKLNEAGSALVYSTYVGGGDTDRAFGIAIDSTRDAYVAGSSNSTNFPTTGGALQTTNRGTTDGFIAKLNSTGSAFLYSTYLGGSEGDSAFGIAVDSAGGAYVTGGTSSTNFPVTPGAYQTQLAGSVALGGDAFISKLNADGSALAYSTYLGGKTADQGNAIAVNANGDAYIVGQTSSDNFPLVATLQSHWGGGFFDGFVTKMNPPGSTLLYSTYLGGADFDIALAVAVDSHGNACVAGGTLSNDFPLVNAFQSTHPSSLSDAFVTKISDTGALSYGISGRVTDASGNGISGVLLTLFGPQSGTLQTGSNGYYSLGNLEAGDSYSLALSKPNYIFTPSSQTFSNISGNQTANFLATLQTQTNPIDDAQFFVRQHYYDLLNRLPDQSGLDYWTGQITQCQNDQTCIRNKRVDVSNAFFFELEYQQSGSYVYRLYRAAFGNNQPFPDPNPDSNYPGEDLKLPNYSVFAQDRAQVVGGSGLAQSQLDLANAFVGRPEFTAKYPANLSTADQFVDAVLATMQNDIGVNLTSQRNALIDLFNSGGRGAVIYRLADDNLQTNPINNRAFIDAEYNRAFVYTQYAGYLRRDADVAGFVFWLGRVNSGPLRDGTKQHAMVCSFITSAEYQLRFSSVVTHSNAECPR